MAKRFKRIRAGRYVREVLYTAPEPRDSARVRAEKSKMTTAARKKMNDKTARVKFEMLIAANFHPSDYVVTLTYRDADLPQSRKEAVERVKKYIKDLREVRKKNRQAMRYVYVTENAHGEGRYHHHLIINRASAGDMEAIRSLWVYGQSIAVILFVLYCTVAHKHTFNVRNLVSGSSLHCTYVYSIISNSLLHENLQNK